jgi:hypothetical protein
MHAETLRFPVMNPVSAGTPGRPGAPSLALIAPVPVAPAQAICPAQAKTAQIGLFSADRLRRASRFASVPGLPVVDESHRR